MNRRLQYHRGRTTKKFCLSLSLAALGGMLSSPAYLCAADTDVSSTPMPPSVRTLIVKNCAVCHHPPNPPLGIDLTTLTFNLNDVDTFGRWVRIHDVVRDGKMPPGGEKSLEGGGSRGLRKCGRRAYDRV